MHTINEFRVREVTRYVVTNFRMEHDGTGGPCSGGSESVGEFDNLSSAIWVATTMARATPGAEFVGDFDLPKQAEPPTTPYPGSVPPAVPV